MTESEKRTLQNHAAAMAKRLLDAKGVEGAFAQATKVLEVGQWLDTVQATPDPTPKLPVKK